MALEIKEYVGNTIVTVDGITTIKKDTKKKKLIKRLQRNQKGRIKTCEKY